MIEFKAPELSDREWVRKIMQTTDNMGCEYCFGNLYMWSAIYNNKIANYNGLFLAQDDTETPMFIYPCGMGNKKAAIEELIVYSEKHSGVPLQLYSVTPNQIEELKTMFPNQFDFIPQRDYFDYIYKTEDLINLSGRKLHGKRNHIAYFKKNYDWKFEPLDKSNMDECFSMNQEWEALNREKNPDEIDNELIAIERAFDKFDELNLLGGLLRANGKVVAYTIGEPINDTVFCTHIEKAFADVRGAYPTINREFAANMLTSYEYINREEDTGSEGLRQAKMSYQPAILLPKYQAIYKG